MKIIESTKHSYATVQITQEEADSIPVGRFNRGAMKGSTMDCPTSWAKVADDRRIECDNLKAEVGRLKAELTASNTEAMSHRMVAMHAERATDELLKELRPLKALLVEAHELVARKHQAVLLRSGVAVKLCEDMANWLSNPDVVKVFKNATKTPQII